MHFNDAESMDRRIAELDREGRKPACMIMEAAMMNLGVVLPEPGYLEAVREITSRHGVVLIFDEVKTGLCIAAGGAVERFGVMPDMVTLAKALGGGMPVGAIGGSEEVMSVVEDGSVFQVGTYNGNPLGMAAARANLTEVLTPEAYQRLDALNDRILRGCSDVIERYGLSGYSVGVGSKGCVTFSPAKIVDYETFKENQDAELADLAWLFNMNRGIFMTPGREEEWTLSVTHTDEAVDRYVATFDEMARDLTADARPCSQSPPRWRRSPLPSRTRAMSRGSACAARTSSWRRPATCASRAAPASSASCCGWRTAIVNLGAGPAELFGERVSLSEMHARQVDRRRAGAALPDRHRRRALLQVGAHARRVVLEVQGRGALRAVGHRPVRPSHDAGAHRAQARLLPARPRSRARRADGPAQRFFGACNQRAGTREVTLGPSVGWADVYPSSYPDNWIDVTGLSGCFSVVHRADPGDGIFESNENNNVSSKIVRLPYKSGPQRCPRRRRLRCLPRRPRRPHRRCPRLRHRRDGSRARRQGRLRHGRDARYRPGDRPAPGRRGLRRRAVRPRRRGRG